MKRVITAALDDRTLSNRTTARVVTDVENILYHAGYNVTFTGVLDEGSLKLKITADEDADKMPNIQIDVVVEDGKVYLRPTLTFPQLTIDWNDPNDYYDNIEHYLNQWKSIGKYISDINQYSFDIEAYKQDLLNGEYD